MRTVNKANVQDLVKRIEMLGITCAFAVLRGQTEITLQLNKHGMLGQVFEAMNPFLDKDGQLLPEWRKKNTSIE